VRALFVLAIAAFAVAGPAYTQEFEPLRGLTGLNLDLDTEEGHSSNWSIEVCEINAIRAEVTTYRLGFHEDWLPVTTLRLDNEDEQVVLQFVAGDRRPPLSARVRLSRDGVMVEETWSTRTIDIGERVDVEVTWDSAGAIEIDVGPETWVVEMSGPPRRFGVSNSTAGTRLDPLTLGRIGEIAGCAPVA
jgi:hypothetical protein